MCIRDRPREMHPPEVPLSTPLALRKHVRGYWKNILGGIGKTCRTPSDTKAPLALRKSAREKTSLGSGGLSSVSQRGLRLGQTCSCCKGYHRMGGDTCHSALTLRFPKESCSRQTAVRRTATRREWPVSAQTRPPRCSASVRAWDWSSQASRSCLSRAC